MKLSRLLKIVCFFFVTLSPLSATSKTFARVDFAALHTDNVPFTSIEDLVNYGKKNTVTDLEALRFYFVWVARNIHYDMAELTTKQRNPIKQEPETVFKNRQGICRGYADLLTVICQKARFECRSVAGYTNTQGTDGRDDLHAWNAIKINDDWFLFDVTWASNYLENTDNIDEKFESYFSQTSQKFIQKHFPFDPIWQLSEYVMPKEAFFQSNNGAVYPDPFGKEPAYQKIYFGDYKKIIQEEAHLDWAQQGIKSFERAINFLPNETRLQEALNYYKGEKAGFLFRQSRILLEQFKDISEEDLKRWTLKDVQNMLSDAQKAATLLSQVLDVYQNMQPAKDDMRAHAENLATIHQNKNVSEKVMVFLESIKTEMKKIPLARGK
jgi:Transglutaminase-like superfamily